MNQDALMFSQESEMAVLGAFLLGGNRSFSIGLELRISVDWFHFPDHRKIFRAVEQVFNNGKGIDTTLVWNRLEETDRGINSQLSIRYLESCIEACTTAAHTVAYLQAVKEKYMRRQVQSMLTAGHDLVSNPEKTSGEVVTGLRQKLYEIDTELHLRKSAREVMQDSIEAFTKAKATGHAGIPSRWIAHQNVLSGYIKGKMGIVAGRPSMGKSTYMGNEVRFGLENGIRDAIISYELSEAEIRQRIICDIIERNLLRFSTGKANDDDLKLFAKANAKLLELPLLINDQFLTQPQVNAFIRDNAPALDRAWIDYLQCQPRSQWDSKDDYTRLSHWLVDDKRIAKESGVALNVLSQLKRPEKVFGKNPEPKAPDESELKGTGAFEENAHQITLIYQDPEVGNEKWVDNTPTIFKVAKNANGIIGETKMVFQKSKHRFVLRSAT